MFRAKRLIAALAMISPCTVLAFNSGSTGSDGALTPTVNTEVVLPPSGILNYTTINIPTGVIVTFKKNATNTPVVLLVSGDVTVAGTINIAGSNSTPVGAAGDGNLGDDGIPGAGGPGGYSGGRGGSPAPGAVPTNQFAGAGLGPGGGSPGFASQNTCSPTSHSSSQGSSGGYAAATQNSSGGMCVGVTIPGGVAYGSSELLPLVGGSGGGGGGGGEAFGGSGGGGGGGAILIAASGTVNVANTGVITADGGDSGLASGQGVGSLGGGGSGGGIRIVATTISGNGSIFARGGQPGQQSFNLGSVGRIRLEAENFTRTATSQPAHTFGAPGQVFIAGAPSLKIKTVAGQNVPASPTGVADITLPASTTNPVSVTFETTGVPEGNTIQLTVSPGQGQRSTAVSNAITGNTTLGTASVNATLPQGPSTLSATLTFTVVASAGDAMSKYAGGERVEKVRLSSTLGAPDAPITLISVSGKEYSVPAALLAAAGL